MPERKWHRLYYEEWVAQEGLDLVKGYHVHNVFTLPLKPWARVNGYAAQIQLDGTGELNAAYVCEIAPGKHLEPIRHVYEELVYVLQGRGTTSVWYQGRRKHTFEWQAGSLFAVPLNAWYQHFNVSGAEPARYLAVTTAPVVMSLYRNDRFVFENDFAFPERFPDEADYFTRPLEMDSYLGFGFDMGVAFTNLVPNVHALDLGDSNRGPDSRYLAVDLAGGTLGAHLLSLPGGTFSKLHRHGPGAHVIWLKGEGYSLMWPDGGEWVQASWGPGTMLVPPSWWWHQHCVVGREPALHLALKLGSRTFKINHLSDGVLRSSREGGSQLDYEDFPPEVMERVKSMFLEECAKRGTTPRMEGVAV